MIRCITSNKLQIGNIVTLICMVFTALSCSKSEVAVVPQADFEYFHDKRSVPDEVYPPRAILFIKNKSVNGESYFWDLGNGETSTEKEPELYYSESGEYTISLTVESVTGDTVTVNKPIRIAEQVVEEIVLANLEWNAIGTLTGWREDQEADIFIEFRKDHWTEDTLLYRTPVVRGISPKGTPISVPVDEKMVVNYYKSLSEASINLYAVDSEGEQHLAFASWASGVGINAWYTSDRLMNNISSQMKGTLIEVFFSWE